ncbi:helix-turn-helix domain-containing protein [Candidatus Woesearchaeota archaeon]|nr:helix-turn-helix domain-containing protein [Candidatus Woesearchaeota archaeon]
MAGDHLFDELGMFLLKKGYLVKSLTSGCFDILARKGEQILLIKILTDANAISKEYAAEMQKVAEYIHASPLIIAEKAGQALEDNVVYTRLGIYALNFQTFKNAVENKYPFVQSTKAGLVASIDSQKLRESRERQGLSLAEISRRIGVSRQMMQRYESESAEITLIKATKMRSILGNDIFKRVAVFERHAIPKEEPEKSPITLKYRKLGFRAIETKKTPFDVIAKKDKEVILTDVGDKVNPNIAPVSRLLDVDRLVIFRKKKPKNIPAITKEEFMAYQEADELVKFLKEF